MARPSLLFLPGHMCDHRAWQPVADHLAARGFRCVHARLDFDDSCEGTATRVLAAYPGQWVTVGFSMGAIAALALHRAQPERLAGLCLVGINAGPDLLERSSARIGQQRQVRAGELAVVTEGQLLPHYFARGCVEGTYLGALCLDMALAVGPDAFVLQSEMLRTRPDARPGLASIACPTLVIGAEEDRLCPPDWHRATASAIAGAELHLIDGAGHMALLEKPEVMAALIGRWLEKNWPEDSNARFQD